MEIQFRSLGGSGDPDTVPIPAGEIHLRPAKAELSDRIDLALLVLEHGPDALAQGQGPISRMVLPPAPTLDQMLATTFARLRLAGQSLPPAATTFARYAALVREGLVPCEAKVAPDVSLEGIYLAILNSPGETDLTKPSVAARFLADWSRLESAILTAIEKQVDPFKTPFLAEGDTFAREQLFLRRDREVYLQDVQRGQRWLVCVPGGPPRASALMLNRPRSVLFKTWSRCDPQTPSGDPYLLLGVNWGEGQWVFSTDPVYRLSLQGLAVALQAAEVLRNPGAIKSGWFDGAPFAHTLVAAPQVGSRLADDHVLGVVRRWAGASAPRWFTRPRMVGIIAVAAVILAVLLIPRLIPAGHHLGRETAIAPASVGPLITILDPAGDVIVRNPSFHLRASIQPGDGSSVKHVQIERNHERLLGVRGLDIVGKGSASPSLSADGSLTFERDVDLRPGANDIQVIASDGSRQNGSRFIHVQYESGEQSKPTLYVLAVGISKYARDDLKLDWAAADATAWAAALKSQKGGLYKDVVVYRDGLTDKEASNQAIWAGFNWLKANANSGDVVAVMLAGHGVLLDEGFFFLPYNADRDQLQATGMHWAAIVQTLKYLVTEHRCKVLLVLDACHSGAIINGLANSRSADPADDELQRAIRDLKGTAPGIWIITSATGNEKSAENAVWKHGVLTLALLEAVTGKRLYEGQSGTPLPATRLLGVGDILAYATQRVQELVGNHQHIVADPGGTPSFPFVDLRPAQPTSSKPN